MIRRVIILVLVLLPLLATYAFSQSANEIVLRGLKWLGYENDFKPPAGSERVYTSIYAINEAGKSQFSMTLRMVFPDKFHITYSVPGQARKTFKRNGNDYCSEVNGQISDVSEDQKLTLNLLAQVLSFRLLYENIMTSTDMNYLGTKMVDDRSCHLVQFDHKEFGDITWYFDKDTGQPMMVHQKPVLGNEISFYFQKFTKTYIFKLNIQYPSKIIHSNPGQDSRLTINSSLHYGDNFHESFFERPKPGEAFGLNTVFRKAVNAMGINKIQTFYIKYSRKHTAIVNQFDGVYRKDSSTTRHWYVSKNENSIKYHEESGNKKIGYLKVGNNFWKYNDSNPYQLMNDELEKMVMIDAASEIVYLGMAKITENNSPFYFLAPIPRSKDRMHGHAITYTIRWSEDPSQILEKGTLFFDPETFLLSAYTKDTYRSNKVIRYTWMNFSNYENYNGIKYPSKWTISSNKGENTVGNPYLCSIIEMAVNEPIPENIFSLNR